MKFAEKKWIFVLLLTFLVIILSAAAIFLPWWSVNTSSEVSAILKAQIKTDYHILQTVIETKTIDNSTEVISVPFGSLSENSEDVAKLSLFFNLSYIITVLGLGCSCLMLILVVLAWSKRRFPRFMMLVGYIAAILLLAAPFVLISDFSASISTLPRLMPSDAPSTWAPISAKDINNFWSAIKIQTKFNISEWAIGGNFWIWGADAGWYLAIAASFLMFLAVSSVRILLEKEMTKETQMGEEKPLIASLLALCGGFLIFINGLLAGINKGPLMLATSTISSPQEVLNSTAPFWARISFGTRGYVEGLWSLVWLIFALIIIYSSVRLYTEPLQRKTLCSSIVLLSVLSILCGGGFVIGAILALIGGGIGFEWPKSPGDTFFGKMIRAARLDGKLYKSLNGNPNSLTDAIHSLILVNILSGLGCGLYAVSTEKIVNAQTLDIPFRLLILGQAIPESSILTPAIINIGMATIKWITLSIIFYFISTLSLKAKPSLEKIATAVALAYVPVSLQFFMPLILFSKQYLTFTWPFVIVLLTNAWMIFALIVAIGQALEISLRKTLGIVGMSGALYLWINQKFFATLDIPYSVKFFIQPESAFLAILACLVAFAMLFGVFKRQ